MFFSGCLTIVYLHVCVCWCCCRGILWTACCQRLVVFIILTCDIYLSQYYTTSQNGHSSRSSPVPNDTSWWHRWWYMYSPTAEVKEKNCAVAEPTAQRMVQDSCSYWSSWSSYLCCRNRSRWTGRPWMENWTSVVIAVENVLNFSIEHNSFENCV